MEIDAVRACASTEFGVLGPLTMRVGDRTDTPRQGRVRTVLALLLLRSGSTVSTDQLVDELWDEDPPATAVNALQVYVSTLRRMLVSGPPGATRQILVTRRPGYVLDIDPSALDLHRFREHAHAGHAALSAGDATTAASRLGSAVGLWRGPALVDVPGRVLQERFVPLLEEERMSAVERLAEARLALGHAEDAAAGLRAETALHPLREHLAALLVSALLRAGRPAEARTAYERIRRLLAGELGLDPGPELSALEARVSSGARPRPAPLAPVEPVPDLGFGAAATPPGPGGAGVRRTGRRSCPAGIRLPPAVPMFTGRDAEVGTVARALLDDGGSASLVEVTGPGGAGKSAVAVQAARHVADRFPDGVMWLALRGSSEQPADAASLLRTLLGALGVDARAVPRTVDERSRLLRSRLAGRRVLLVLDDAAGERQVRPLLPATPGTAVLVTGRVRLAGLDGVHTVPLAQLDPADAIRLLVHGAGALRVGSDPAAAGQIVRACGRMPLAVRIAGARLAARPQMPLATFAAELGDERQRLDLLSMGDLAVRATIATGYRRCRRRERLALALLARLQPGEVPAWVVAVLLEDDLWAGTRVVERLVEAHLLLARGYDGLDQPRYEQHDLVRLFSREQDAADAGAAFARLAEVLTGLFARAEHAVRRSPGGPAPEAAHGPGVDDGLLATIDTDPVRWATGELPVALATLERVDADARPELAFALARGMTWLLEMRGERTSWASVQAIALRAARAVGDPAATAWALLSTGDLERARGRPWAAVAAYGRARASLDRCGDRPGAARAELRLAAVYADRGPMRRAEVLAARAAAVLTARGDRSDVVAVHELQGQMHRDRGRVTAAERCLRAAADLSAELGDRRRTAANRAALVGLLVEQERADEAEPLAQEGVATYRALGDRRSETYARLDLAAIALCRHRLTDAVERLGACAEEFDALGDVRASALVGLRLGEVRGEEGRVAAAIGHLRSARARFGELGDARGSAAADLALGRAYAGVGYTELAAGCLLDAAERFDRIGLGRQARIARGEARPLIESLAEARRGA